MGRIYYYISLYGNTKKNCKLGQQTITINVEDGNKILSLQSKNIRMKWRNKGRVDVCFRFVSPRKYNCFLFAFLSQK